MVANRSTAIFLIARLVFKLFDVNYQGVVKSGEKQAANIVLGAEQSSRNCIWTGLSFHSRSMVCGFDGAEMMRLIAI